MSRLAVSREDSVTSINSARSDTALPMRWGWVFALGVLCITLGIVGLFMTIALTVAGVFWYGVLLIVAGIAQIAEAVFNTPSHDRR